MTAPTFTLDQVVQKEPGRLTPFVQHLLGMDPRIRLYGMIQELDETKVYIPTKTAIYIPYEFPRIEHEISHFVEMEPEKRWVKPDWGLGVNSRFLDTTTVPHLVVAAARETRVRAIESKLDTSYGGNLLSNSFWSWGLRNRAIGFGKFKSFNDISYWLNEMSARTRATYNLDRIEDAWKTRIQYVQNWMETK